MNKKSLNPSLLYFSLFTSGIMIICFCSNSISSQPSSDQESLKTNPPDKEGVLLNDLARIEGIRSNQLLGYGIVVGLRGTGDTRSKFASSSIQNLLGGLGQKQEPVRLTESRNIAAVLVTAEIPPFANPGDRLGATVSSIGDARSLEGGVLIQTPLYAGNKKIYAVAQGSLTSGGAEGRTRTHKGKTVVSLLSGVVIEKELPSLGGIFDTDSDSKKRLRISLYYFDFSTLSEVQKKLQKSFPQANASVKGGSLLIDIPPDETPVAFIAKIQKIRVKPSYRSRVVINERSGTVIMGGELHVDPVAISRGGMELIISPKQQSSYAGIHLSNSSQKQKAKKTTQSFSGSSVNEIIQALNAMDANVKDIISILEALKDSGALHAELIIN